MQQSLLVSVPGQFQFYLNFHFLSCHFLGVCLICMKKRINFLMVLENINFKFWICSTWFCWTYGSWIVGFWAFSTWFVLESRSVENSLSNFYNTSVVGTDCLKNNNLHIKEIAAFDKWHFMSIIFSYLLREIKNIWWSYRLWRNWHPIILLLLFSLVFLISLTFLNSDTDK